MSLNGSDWLAVHAHYWAKLKQILTFFSFNLKTKYIWNCTQILNFKRLEVNLRPLAFLFLNCLAWNIEAHIAFQFYNNIFLNYLYHLHLPWNSWIAAQIEKSRAHVSLKIWVGHKPVRNYIYRNIHPQSPPSLGLFCLLAVLVPPRPPWHGNKGLW